MLDDAFAADLGRLQRSQAGRADAVYLQVSIQQSGSHLTPVTIKQFATGVENEVRYIATTELCPTDIQTSLHCNNQTHRGKKFSKNYQYCLVN